MKKYQNILTNSSVCLTTETMQKYIAETLSKEEKRNVEMHLADCEICSDELEGLMLLQNPEQLNVLVDKLNKKIDLKTKSKSELVFLQIKPYYSAAALVLVLISISIFLVLNDFSTSNQKTADSMSKEEMTFSAEPTIESEKLSEEKSISTDTFISSLEKNEKLLADNSSSKNRKEKLVIVDDISETDADIDFEVNDEFEEYLEEDSSNLVASGNAGFISSNDDFVIETPIIKKDEAKEKVTMLYEEEAAEEKEDYVLSDIENSKARSTISNKKSKSKGNTIKPLTLDKAISEFKEKNFQSAINLLDSLKQKPKSENHYKAQWYKALSYIGLDKTLKAKIILKELSEVKNSYQAKAKRKLKVLKVE